MTSFFELELMISKFVESKGFKLHSSTFIATGKTHKYTLIISKKSKESD